MDSRRPAGIATFFADPPLEVGRIAELGASEAHHVRVRRLEAGEPVRLVDGVGGVGAATLAKVSKGLATAMVDDVTHVPQSPAIHLLVPIADRDRMLWLAEKATELGLTSWRAVMWRRSHGVAPRGEGESFHTKLRMRMIAALTQSGGAWLPTVMPDVAGDDVPDADVHGARYFLDVGGEPMLSVPLAAPLTIAVGPEGGLDDEERARLTSAGWIPLSLGGTTLRFETAGIAALAIARAAFAANVESPRG